jgi:hypothetical protein
MSEPLVAVNPHVFQTDITLLPFPKTLLSEFLLHPEAKVVGAVYLFRHGLETPPARHAGLLNEDCLAEILLDDYIYRAPGFLSRPPCYLTDIRRNAREFLLNSVRQKDAGGARWFGRRFDCFSLCDNLKKDFSLSLNLSNSVPKEELCRKMT